MRYVGATPVFCDIDEQSGTLDPDLLADLLSARARRGRVPAAVMPVDIYGMCADYDAIRAVCEPYGVPIIEDAAAALGSIGGGRFAGTHGDLGAFSFNGNKIITTSGGGALVGPPDKIERAAKLATQSRDAALHYEHADLGYSYRLSNLLAALGRAQLRSLEDRIARRTAINERYRRGLPGLGWFPQRHTERPNNWLSVALLPDDIAPAVVCGRLAAAGIEARPTWKPMHQQPAFGGAESVGGQVADRLFTRGICLPSGSQLAETEQERVIEIVRAAVDRSDAPASLVRMA